MLKTIIFDIDGVITNLSFFHYLAWKSVFSFYNVEITNHEWESIVGLPRMTIANRIIKKHHLSLTPDEIQQITEQKNALFIHLIKHGLSANDVTNGVRQLIDDAISRGLQLVAISSSANAILEIECLGLRNKFIYVSSYDKPAIKNLSKQEKLIISPLTLALKTLGIKPDECIGLEDHVDGIMEFKREGIFAVAIAHYHEDIKQYGDY
jgi:beta-phosphoglucomutase